MASPFPGHANAFQVGSYFLNHYYQILQSHPHLACQFYTNGSTMVRLDSCTMDSATATGLVQINNIVMCLNLNGIEIKTANFLDSWGGGILVVVSGLVQLKEYSGRRRFVQTFFLAPQEKGYFVLNDIFKFLGDEYDHRQQDVNYICADYESKMNTSETITETVPNYNAGEEVEAKEIMARVRAAESDTVDKYENCEVQQQSPLEYETITNGGPIEDPALLFSSSVNIKQDVPPAAPVHASLPFPEEEPLGELPKQTYASVLRTKGQAGHPVPHSTSLNKTTIGTPDVQQVAQSTQQQLQPVLVPEKSISDTFQDTSMPEDEEEFLSVYVGNLSPSTSVLDLEKVFQAFGRIKPDGVAIRSRKEAGVFYGFVEFEDNAGIQNALRASPIELNGRLIHVEERRPNSGFSRGGRRGRGRGGYPSDLSRGQFGGRSFGRGGGQDHERDYTSRSRGNGFQKRGGRQEGFSRNWSQSYEGYD